MKYKRSADTVVLRVDRGEEIISAVKEVCVQEHIACAAVSGIGAVGHAVVGLYHVAGKQFHSNTFDCELEMTSLLGNVSEKDGKVYLHLHAVFAKEDGQALGGHLSEAVVSGTAEIFITVLQDAVGRFQDPVTGLNLFDL